MNSSLSSSEFIPHGCVVYEVMGGRLHQPSILTQAFLIIIIVVIILTSPVTAASELACDDRRQNESSAESSQVKHYTRLASLNRFNCRGPCTALMRRFDENNLT